MGQIVQAGSFSAANATVPDLYVIITPPSSGGIVAAPTNVGGISGAASWGAVDVATSFGDPASLLAAFGPVTVRKYDLATVATVAMQQGASAFYGVRVTDGTDVGASVTLSPVELAKAPTLYAAMAAAINGGVGVNRNASSLVTFNAQSGILAARYTGIVGNAMSVTVTVGSRIGTFRAVVSNSVLGGPPEVYDNLIPGQSDAPTPVTYTLTGGTDGATGLTAAKVAGGNTATPTGVFALHGRGCAAIVPVDCDDQTQWSAMAGWAYGEGIFVGVSGPSGETIADAQLSKGNAGIDDYSMKVLLGDYVYWNDVANNQIRLVSPQGFWLGKRLTLAPNDSCLNKQLTGVVGTAHSGLITSGALVQYTNADVQNLVLSGIDAICNPVPGGAYWGFRVGRNSSSDSTRNGENYTMMTFFMAKSVNGYMGKYVGSPIDTTDMQNAYADLSTFGANLVTFGLVNGFRVVLDASNNPQSLTALGFLSAAFYAQLQGINEKFLISLEDGATVTIG